MVALEDERFTSAAESSPRIDREIYVENWTPSRVHLNEVSLLAYALFSKSQHDTQVILYSSRTELHIKGYSGTDLSQGFGVSYIFFYLVSLWLYW